jgi:hypothetical protein|tara:strand:+ start:749 stop:1075 length:327 start_codon:yes stop_codon:yes gene_type:complete
MGSPEFASGKHAFGFCDRCGFRYDLSSLKWEFEDKKNNGLRVCEPCLDPDHPQLQLGRFRVYDPQTLRDPRPDNSRVDSVSLFGWKPVGAAASLEMTISIGSVTVTTS